MHTFDEVCAIYYQKEQDYINKYNSIPAEQRIEIPIAAVMKLRKETGCGVLMCKAALHESNLDNEKAKEILREFAFIYC